MGIVSVCYSCLNGNDLALGRIMERNRCGGKVCEYRAGRWINVVVELSGSSLLIVLIFSVT